MFQEITDQFIFLVARGLVGFYSITVQELYMKNSEKVETGHVGSPIIYNSLVLFQKLSSGGWGERQPFFGPGLEGVVSKTYPEGGGQFDRGDKPSPIV